MQVPKLERKLKAIQEENTRLEFAIEKFENPINLMELSRKPEYSHLKHPIISDIIHLKLPNDQEPKESMHGTKKQGTK